MNNKNQLLGASIIMAVALLLCAYILKDSNLLKSHIPSPANHLSVSLSNADRNLEIKDKQVLSLWEAAAYLHVDSDALKDLLSTQGSTNIPYMKIGNNFIFSKKALDEWVEQGAKSHLHFIP